MFPNQLLLVGLKVSIHCDTGNEHNVSASASGLETASELRKHDLVPGIRHARQAPVQAVLAALPTAILAHMRLAPLERQARHVQQPHSRPRNGALRIHIHPHPLLHLLPIFKPDPVACPARVPVPVPEVAR